MLWLFLVVRKTVGDGLGTYLDKNEDERCIKFKNILPRSVDIQRSQEPNQCVPHKRDTA
jgi:hypothetical protein